MLSRFYLLAIVFVVVFGSELVNIFSAILVNSYLKRKSDDKEINLHETTL